MGGWASKLCSNHSNGRETRKVAREACRKREKGVFLNKRRFFKDQAVGGWASKLCSNHANGRETRKVCRLYTSEGADGLFFDERRVCQGANQGRMGLKILFEP